MAVKDIFVRALRAQRIVAIVELRLLTNLTYLLTYLHSRGAPPGEFCFEFFFLE